MYTVLGATGNIGSVITKKLLEKGEKVRGVGRNAGKLQQYVHKGAEEFVADIKDAEGLTKALTGVRAAFLMMPPGLTSPDYRADQEAEAYAISVAARNSGLQYAVNLSSIGAHAPAGTGPILGQHDCERKLNAVERLNVLHLRPANFMENNLSSIEMIQIMEVLAVALRPDLKFRRMSRLCTEGNEAERF